MPNRRVLSMQAQASSLFQIDPLSSSEFFAACKPRAYLEPERVLMLAILQDAITCLQKYLAFGSRGNKRLFDEAKDWIQAEDSEWLFSFDNVCEAVGLNPRYLRPRLIKMTELQTGSGLRRKVIPSVMTGGMKSAAGDPLGLRISAGARQQYGTRVRRRTVKTRHCYGSSSEEIP